MSIAWFLLQHGVILMIKELLFKFLQLEDLTMIETDFLINKVHNNSAYISLIKHLICLI